MSASSLKNKDNKQIFERNIPNVQLESYLSTIPESTRYNYPDLSGSKRTKDLETNHFQKRKNYNQHAFFNPGTNAPWKGFSSNVDTESVLKNQVYALQRSNQSIYVPGSQSDLYNTTVPKSKRTNSLLFQQPQFAPETMTPHPSIGTNLWMNDTRGQLRNI